MKKRAPKQRPKDPLDIAMGARIKEVRRAQKPRVSQEWLAMEIGCATAQVQKYESGENAPRWSRLCKIARALDIDVLELIRPLVPPRL